MTGFVAHQKLSGILSLLLSLISSMDTKYVDLLQERISAQKDWNTLLRFLPLIGINVVSLQSMMREFICSLKESAAKRALFNVSPIDAILPMDVLQNVAAFDHYTKLQLINKSFKACYERNQEMTKKLIPQIVDECEHLFAPQINHDKDTNKIFVVHPEGQPVSRKVAEYGDVVIPSSDLRQCINSAKSGDTVLIQNGTFVLQTQNHGFQVDIRRKHLQIIGIEDNVRIHFKDPVSRQSCWRISEGSHVLLQNVEIECDVKMQVWVIESNFWMNECNVHSPGLLGSNKMFHITGGSSIWALRSRFINEQIHICHTWREENEITLIGCTLEGNEPLVIEMPQHRALKCIGNVFNRSRISAWTGNECNVYLKGNLFYSCGS